MGEQKRGTQTKLPEKVSLFGQRGSILAVQGVDGSLGVGNVELLDVSNPAQACDLAIDRVECTGSLKLALSLIHI